MRRGAKRKATRKPEPEAPEDVNTAAEAPEDVNTAAEAPEDVNTAAEAPANKDQTQPSSKSTDQSDPQPKKSAQDNKPPKVVSVSTRAKRQKLPNTEPQPEYFPEKRNLEDLWTHVFPVGTEWDVFDQVYKFKWSFTNLEDAFEDGGELCGKKVFLFACTEPQFVSFRGERSVTYIPVVVAIVSDIPPSDKIGIKSVQRENEDIVPMRKMKMAWVPYIPLENRGSQVERLQSQIFILSCTQRRAGLKHLKEDRVKNFEYCLPYFYQPFQEDDLEQSTIVQIIFPAEPKPVFCEFDWELDELEEFATKLVEEEELSEDQKNAFKEFVKEKVREGKRANREAREARKKAIEEMSEETKNAFMSMRFYKFYPVPTPDTPDVSEVKSPFINRYYGKAHKVF